MKSGISSRKWNKNRLPARYPFENQIRIRFCSISFRKSNKNRIPFTHYHLNQFFQKPHTHSVNLSQRGESFPLSFNEKTKRFALQISSPIEKSVFIWDFGGYRSPSCCRLLTTQLLSRTSVSLWCIFPDSLVLHTKHFTKRHLKFSSKNESYIR